MDGSLTPLFGTYQDASSKILHWRIGILIQNQKVFQPEFIILVLNKI